MPYDASVGITLSIREALRANTCEKRGEIYSLSLLSGNEENGFLSKLKEIQGSCLGKEDAAESIDTFIRSNIKREWYHTDFQFKAVIEEEAAYQKALASFFIGKETVESNVRWKVPVSFTSGTVSVCEVYGYVHAIFREDSGRHTAVIFLDGKPVYSMRARKFENKLENAPELIGAYLSLREKYGDDMRLVLAYSRPKDSKKSTGFDETQILSWSFKGVSEAELMERFEKVLTEKKETSDCSTCRYSSLCSGMNIPKAEKKENADKKRNPRFTEDQQKLVDFKDGACAVYAVPGAGKTTSLVYRLKKLLDAGVDAKSILFVTFTNKACEEIRERVKELLNADFEEELPDIFTYNGLGWQILRDNREIVGDLKLLSSLDEKLFLMECISELEEPLKGFNMTALEGRYGLLNELLRSFRAFDGDEKTAEKEFSRLLNNGKDPKQVQLLKEIVSHKISEYGYIGYDEQITLAYKLLSENPKILKEYGKQWRYIMADEFQDSSQDNVDLLYLLANAGKRNLVVVGDADQSIYEWRNASPKHLVNFQEVFPGAQMIYMRDNFRSVKNILAAANSLISKNANRVKMSMVAHKDATGLPNRVKNCSVREVPFIIEQLIKSNYQYGSIAVLSRNNAPLAKVKGVLDEKGIGSVSPTELLTRDAFFVLLKDILDMFFIGFTDTTDISMYRYLLACGITPPTKQEKKETLYKNLVVHYDVVPLISSDIDSMMAYEVYDADMAENELYESFRRLYFLFLEFLSPKYTPQKALKAVASAFDADKRMPSILELEKLIDFQDFSTLKDLWHYLQFMVDFGDDTKVEHEPSLDKVNLMTAHSSKGKEFPAVIILQSEDFTDTEEERRLLYVAMTRAEKVLFALETPGSESGMLNEIAGLMNTVRFA